MLLRKANIVIRANANKYHLRDKRIILQENIYRFVLLSELYQIEFHGRIKYKTKCNISYFFMMDTWSLENKDLAATKEVITCHKRQRTTLTWMHSLLHLLLKISAELIATYGKKNQHQSIYDTFTWIMFLSFIHILIICKICISNHIWFSNMR